MNELQFWLTIGATGAALMAGPVILIRWLDRRRTSIESNPRAVVTLVRARAPKTREEMQRIIQGWSEQDMRWEVIEDLMEHYSQEALANAAAADVVADPQVLAHALGAWLGIQQVWGAMQELRRRPRAGKCPDGRLVELGNFK